MFRGRCRRSSAVFGVAVGDETVLPPVGKLDSACTCDQYKHGGNTGKMKCFARGRARATFCLL
jgi:hypothetical protein